MTPSTFVTGIPMPQRQRFMRLLSEPASMTDIIAMDRQYDRMVGENGRYVIVSTTPTFGGRLANGFGPYSNLSGGQRQRVALARMIIQNPKVLLLDEPTSAQDADTESRVRDALNKAFHGTTCLVIAYVSQRQNLLECERAANRLFLPGTACLPSAMLTRFLARGRRRC